MSSTDNNNKNAAIPGTVESQEYIAEVKPSMTASHDNNNLNIAIPGTVGAHEYVAEVDGSTLTGHDNNEKNAAIPDTVNTQDYAAEINHCVAASRNDNDKNAAIPGTLGAQDQTTEVGQPLAASQDHNDKCGAIPGTVGTLEQTAEVGNSQGKAARLNDLGVLRLRGDYQPPDLTPAQCESYKTDGYLVIPNVITSDEADKLLGEAHSLMSRVSEGGEGIIRHDVSGNRDKVPSPVGRILATFEPEDESTTNPFLRRVARLGCGIHHLRTFHLLTHSTFNQSVVRALGYADPRLTQSQLIAKLAGIGGEIVPHQDGCVSFTDPPSAVTFWYALEDTTLDNGCLCVAPGSHLTEPIRQRLVKQDNGRPRFEDLVTPLWAKGAKVISDEEMVRKKEGYDYRALEVKKGTLVVFHGNLMHKSGTNTSEKNRISYNFNVVEGGADCLDGTYLKPAGGDYERL